MTFRLAAPSTGHLNEGELPCSFLRCHWTKMAWTRIKSYLCESITEDSWYYPFNFYQFSLLLIFRFSLLHHTVNLLHNLFLYHCWCLFCVLLFDLFLFLLWLLKYLFFLLLIVIIVGNGCGRGCSGSGHLGWVRSLGSLEFLGGVNLKQIFCFKLPIAFQLHSLI